MYAKSFMALDGKGRLTGARTAQTAPYDRYRCHLCGSAMQYHPEYQTQRPWFEHRHDGLTENGRQHCPYVNPEPEKAHHIRQLQGYVPDARPLVYKSDWHCSGCDSEYHGEHYCLTCRTGEHSRKSADADNLSAEVTTCVC
ncbi:putative zinc ribbon protein [Enterobacter ludwigii]